MTCLFARVCTIFGLFAMSVMAACAQHEHHMPMPGMPAPSEEQTAPMEHMAMPGHPSASPTLLYRLPESRFGSGTSWMPDSTPMYGLMGSMDGWDVMYHGAAHLAYDVMNGPRGDEKLIIPNWAMAMADTPIGERDAWRLGLMLSLDPFTVGGSGYPLLFQTGETWNDEPLIDHQHPHNFVSELSGRYTHAFSRESAGYFYLAPVGEPALGPPAYMHRTFALDDPLAPIGHHWQDASHITYNVITAGYQTRRWQLDASVFNGREPGENRFEVFVSPTFDSYSGRISYNPSLDLAMQLSYAYLESPEALHPDENANRTTASVIYNRLLSDTRNWQTSLVWGRNTITGLKLDSYMIETQLKQDGGWTPYLRYEYVRKDAEELVLPDPPYAEDDIFNLQQLTLGVVHDFPLGGDYQWGIGGQAILNFVPEELQPVYGDDPLGWVLYIRVHPRRMVHENEATMEEMPGMMHHD